MDFDNRFSSYSPSYIYEQDPQYFGGQQADYLARSEQIITETAEKISSCRTNGGNFKKLFFEIIEDLGQKRAQIAKEHGTKNAELFGRRRDRYYAETISTLALDGVYREHGNKILQFLAPHLDKMKTPNRTFQKKYKIEEDCDGYHSTLTIKVISPQEAAAKKNNLQNLGPVLAEMREKNLSSPDKWTEEEITKRREKIRQFKQSYSNIYHDQIAYNAIVELGKQFPGPAQHGVPAHLVRSTFEQKEANEILANLKSQFVYAVLRTKINGQSYRLTEYCTWMYENLDDPVQRMLKNSKVLLVHQDELLIQEFLDQVISQIFIKAVTWDKNTQTLQDLKNTMTLYTNLTPHNMSDIRGSAAKLEWMEAAIYKSHEGVEVDLKDRKLDLEAFAAPFLSTYKDYYNQETVVRLVEQENKS